MKTGCARNAARSRVLEKEGREDLGFGSMALGNGEKGEPFFVRFCVCMLVLYSD